MSARKNHLVRWTSPLHWAIQTEIGKQLRLLYDLPQEFPPGLAAAVARLESPVKASPEVKRLHAGEDRHRRLLQRAMECENAAGRALNEGIKEIYLDLAGQYRNLARQNELAFATK